MINKTKEEIEQLANELIGVQFCGQIDVTDEVREYFVKGYTQCQETLTSRIVELEAQIESLTNLAVMEVSCREDEWISVEDRLPSEGKSYLFYSAGMNIILYYQSPEYFFYNEYQWRSPVTHWMPLPNPPKTPNKMEKSAMQLLKERLFDVRIKQNPITYDEINGFIELEKKQLIDLSKHLRLNYQPITQNNYEWKNIRENKIYHIDEIINELHKQI